MRKQLFGLLGAVMIAAASVPITAAAEAEPENYERKCKSPDDLYDCIVWNESSIGEVTFDGKDLINMSLNDMYKIRGNDISVIFQEPMTSLNPVFSIEKQIAETYMLHQGMKPLKDLFISM